MWKIVEDSFHPEKQHHKETVFTIGNGYLSTRGAFEENHPGDRRATFLHGVFDDVPVVFTELVNAPDWLEMEIYLDGEHFRLFEGELLSFTRTLDLYTATLRRDVRWQSPRGNITHFIFERFASLADEHLCAIRVMIVPENYSGRVEVRTGINGEADNLGFKHWEWLDQGMRGQEAWLLTQTRVTKIELGAAVHLSVTAGGQRSRMKRWDAHNHPTLVAYADVEAGQVVDVNKYITYYTSREGVTPLKSAQAGLRRAARKDWSQLWEEHRQAWQAEWDRCDVLIEGDEEAQLAIRFNLFQLLIAAPRHDEHVNLGAKTLSGYGYRGHSFWDTEIFMLPFFIYVRPEIARLLLSYRWHNLAGAKAKAEANGYRGAQYPWESAATGEEVTPTWVPSPWDRTKLIRIWTGDIEIHISADVALGMWKYWQATGDDQFMFERGAEVILETARFWSSRAEWNQDSQRYEIRDIIGPDEYHDHVDNNAYTNALARWNLQTALAIQSWLKTEHAAEWETINSRLQLTDEELQKWQHVIDHIYLPFDPQTKLVEQFQGYFQRRDVNLATLEPRTESVQSLFGIEGANETQVIKQPDVLMLMYLLPELYGAETVKANYDYYNARTDHTFGSSLGPSIQAIMACKVGDAAGAYEHFMRAARADLFDVRNNAGDGIHGASAGGLWQAVVFGFAGLERIATGWKVNPHLPEKWNRVAFKIVDRGNVLTFDVKKVS
ncbi:MAG TPA: glycoside hydrolase family 65 protein [Anaerolineales bacterium]|nr:glycoside hydrolase family 65 protein [Anaerolineales bacterium]